MKETRHAETRKRYKADSVERCSNPRRDIKKAHHENLETKKSGEDNKELGGQGGNRTIERLKLENMRLP